MGVLGIPAPVIEAGRMRNGRARARVLSGERRPALTVSGECSDFLTGVGVNCSHCRDTVQPTARRRMLCRDLLPTRHCDRSTRPPTRFGSRLVSANRTTDHRTPAATPGELPA